MASSWAWAWLLSGDGRAVARPATARARKVVNCIVGCWLGAVDGDDGRSALMLELKG